MKKLNKFMQLIEKKLTKKNIFLLLSLLTLIKLAVSVSFNTNNIIFFTIFII